MCRWQMSSYLESSHMADMLRGLRKYSQCQMLKMPWLGVVIQWQCQQLNKRRANVNWRLGSTQAVLIAWPMPSKFLEGATQRESVGQRLRSRSICRHGKWTTHPNQHHSNYITPIIDNDRTAEQTTQELRWTQRLKEIQNDNTKQLIDGGTK